MREAGQVDSEERRSVTPPPVDRSEDGARALGLAYRLAVRRTSLGLVRPREGVEGMELVVPGLRPALLAFGPPRLEVDGDAVSCSYPIAGGLLARRPGGSLALVQAGAGPVVELRVSVTGFHPRLGRLYAPLQRPFHAAVSRRFFRIVAERGA